MSCCVSSICIPKSFLEVSKIIKELDSNSMCLRPVHIGIKQIMDSTDITIKARPTLSEIANDKSFGVEISVPFNHHVYDEYRKTGYLSDGCKSLVGVGLRIRGMSKENTSKILSMCNAIHVRHNKDEDCLKIYTFI